MDDAFGLPKVLLMGLKKSGKSSIQKVVFEGMQPHESVNLATTVQPDKTTVKSNEFVRFEVWDFPGQNDPFDPNNAGRFNAQQILENCGAIVFVMDCTDEPKVAVTRLVDTICAAYTVNPDLSVEVFIHKVDALNEDQQSDLLGNVRRTVEDTAKQRLETKKQLKLNFNLTSIYDHSVFQAFSLVVQKLIRRQLPYLVELLSMMNANSNVDLSYLFLSRSKIFIAVDERNRQKVRTYDLCSDAIDIMVRMDRIYSDDPTGETDGRVTSSPTNHTHADDEDGSGASAGKRQQLASSTIHLSSDDVVYVRELKNELTLVMMLRDEQYQNKALIDYNIAVFCNAVNEVFQAGGK